MSELNLKLFGKNSVIYAIGNLSLRGSSFLLIPLYTHFLSISDYGLLATLILTIQVLITFMDLGTRKSFIRFAAEYEEQGLMGTFLGSTIFLRLVGSAVIIAAAVLFFNPLFARILHMEDVFDYVILTCMAAFAQSMCYTILGYYRARNEGMKYMGSSFVVIIILTIMTAIFLVPLKMGVKGVMYAQIFAYGVAWLFLSAKIFSVTGVGFSKKIARQLLSFGLPLIFMMSGYLIMDTSVVYLLSFFLDLEEVGIYSLGYKLAQISGILLIAPFQLAYEPFIYANLNRPDIKETIARLLTYLMFIFTILSVILVFIFRDLLSIIAPIEYKDAYLIMFLVLPGLAFKAGHNIGQSLLLIHKKSHIAGSIIAVFTVINLFLQYTLIPLFGKYAAVLVVDFTLISILITYMIIGRRYVPIPIEKPRLIITALIFIGLMSFIFLMSFQQSFIFYSVVPLVVSGTIVTLYRSQFLSTNEKVFLKGIYQRLAEAVSH